MELSERLGWAVYLWPKWRGEVKVTSREESGVTTQRALEDKLLAPTCTRLHRQYNSKAYLLLCFDGVWGSGKGERVSFRPGKDKAMGVQCKLFVPAILSILARKAGDVGVSPTKVPLHTKPLSDESDAFAPR